MKNRHHDITPFLGNSRVLRYRLSRKYSKDVELNKTRASLKEIETVLLKATSRKGSDEKLQRLLEKLMPVMTKLFNTIQTRVKNKRTEYLAIRMLQSFAEIDDDNDGDSNRGVCWTTSWDMVASSMGSIMKRVDEELLRKVSRKRLIEDPKKPIRKKNRSKKK